ncbi:hypothetical protein LZ554_003676 [Drepanopeziza brunnea f. sp. 'monogermtubi']|nr:hypothetical protein LZ554_003676 [Drepanopeziza brunnea f. sp. 'monogermtubi']
METGKVAVGKMVGTSGNHRAPLKTYSRRKTHTTSEQTPAKRKRAEEAQSPEELPPAKKFAPSSIKNYFQPLSSSSSPAQTRAAHQPSDDLASRSTPPSSPPTFTSSSPSPKTAKPPCQLLRRRKRPKRRLTTKLDLSPIKMATSESSVLMNCCIEGTCQHDNNTARLARNEKTLSAKFDEEDGYTNTIDNIQAPSLDVVLASIPLTFEHGRRTANMIQTLILAGQNPPRCSVCKLPFNTNNAEDIITHKLVHNNIEFFNSNKHDLSVITDPAWTRDVGSSHKITFCKFDEHASLTVREFAIDVVRNKVDRALGYVGYEANANAEADKLGGDMLSGVAKVYIAFVGPPGLKPALRAVGVVVVRRAIAASLYSRQDGQETWTAQQHDCDMIVDRIWVDEEYRKLVPMSDEPQHLATRLVDFARLNFYYGYTVAKEKTAFSQPTSSGYRFACRYFDGVWGPGKFLAVKL